MGLRCCITTPGTYGATHGGGSSCSGPWEAEWYRSVRWLGWVFLGDLMPPHRSFAAVSLSGWATATHPNSPTCSTNGIVREGSLQENNKKRAAQGAEGAAVGAPEIVNHEIELAALASGWHAISRLAAAAGVGDTTEVGALSSQLRDLLAAAAATPTDYRALEQLEEALASR